MFNKEVPYIVQPYLVGTKHGKSLAVIIPAKFAKKNEIDESTIFVLKNDYTAEKITLQKIKYREEEKSNAPTGESVDASYQQASVYNQ